MYDTVWDKIGFRHCPEGRVFRGNAPACELAGSAFFDQLLNCLVYGSNEVEIALE